MEWYRRRNGIGEGMAGFCGVKIPESETDQYLPCFKVGIVVHHKLSYETNNLKRRIDHFGESMGTKYRPV
jgi:hypothetical protein